MFSFKIQVIISYIPDDLFVQSSVFRLGDVHSDGR